MRRITLLLVMVILLGFTTHVDAQTDPKTCKPADVIAKAVALKSTGDSSKDMKALLDLAAQIEAANIACNGMKYQKNGTGVVGPFDLAEGEYKVTVTSSSIAFMGQLKAMSGDCAPADTLGAMTGSLFNVLNMDGKSQVNEALIDSKGCRATIQVSNVTKPWTLTIEAIQ